MRSYILSKLKATVGLLVIMIISSQAMSQSTTGIFFQAVARDNYSNPAMNRKIYVQSSIIQTTATGTKLLIEEYDVTTDGSGVFSISIGNGKKVGGTASGLNSIDWSKGPFYLNLKVAITPVASSNGWDYTKEWTDMGTTNFGAVPYALYSASSATNDTKLNISDTAAMLSKRFARDTASLSDRINYAITRAFAEGNSRLNIADTAAMLSRRFANDTISLSNRIIAENSRATAQENLKLNITDTVSMSSRINTINTELSTETTRATAAEHLKLNIADTAAMLSRRFEQDTISLSNRINTKEDVLNKSTSTSLGTSDLLYPTQNAVKTYVDAATPSASASIKGLIKIDGDLSGTAELPVVAAGAITTAKIADANVTTSKIADGAITHDKLSSSLTLGVANGGTGAINASDARTNLGLIIGTDVQSPLSFSEPLFHSSNVVGINTATITHDGYLNHTDFAHFNNKLDASEKAVSNGVATLGSDGKIPSAQLPAAISLTSAHIVANRAAMLALTVGVGSLAIDTSIKRNFILGAEPASDTLNWKQLAVSTTVSTVNNIPGPYVVLSTNDIAEGSTNKYYTDTKARAAIGATSPLSYSASTGIFSMAAASTSANGYLSSANFTTFNNKQSALTFGTGLTNTSNTISVNTSQNISRLSNLTTNGIVTTTGAAGNLLIVPTLPFANGGTGATTAAAALTSLGAEPTINKSINVTTDAASDIKFPSVKAVKTYVDGLNADGSITSAKIVDGTITNIDISATAGIKNSQLATPNSTIGTTSIPLGSTSTTLAGLSSVSATTFVGTLSGTANTATTATNISAISNTTLTSLANLSTVGIIKSGLWESTPIGLANGGTGATTAAASLTNLGGEPTINKSTSVSSDGASDIKFPSAKAVKTYVDGQISAGGVADNSITSAKIANYSITNTDIKADSLTSLPYLTTVGTILKGSWDGSPIALAYGGTGATSAPAALTNLGAEAISNKSISVTTDATSDTKFPSVKAVKTYVDAQLSTGGVADNSITTAKIADSTIIARDISGTAGITTRQLATPFAMIGTSRIKLDSTSLSLAGLSSVTATTFIGALSGNASTASNITATSNTTLTSLPNLSTVGTISAGIWNGTTIALTHGGTGATSAAAALTSLGAEATINKSTNVTTDATSDTKFPSVKAIKTYVDGLTADGSVTSAKIADSTIFARDISGSAGITTRQLATPFAMIGTTRIKLDSTSLSLAGLTTINNTAIPTSKTLVVTTDKLNALAATTSAELAGIISDETGTGTVVLSISPTFTGTPTLPTGTIGVTQAAGNNSTALATTAFVAAVNSINSLRLGIGAGNIASNIAIGLDALGKNTTGYSNTANGRNSLNNNTTGYQNTANGDSSLFSNTTGFRNNSNGWQSLYSNTTGQNNTADGHKALFNNTTGSYNTALGSGSLTNITGNYNTAIGYLSFAGASGTATSNNTAVGYNTLSSTQGSNNTAIGTNADVTSTFTNSTAIGYEAIAAASNTIQLGNSSVTNVTTSGALKSNGIISNVSSKSANYTLLLSDEIIIVTAVVNITLPTAIGNTGRTYTIKRNNSGSATINTTSSQTIDGAATYSLAANKAVKVVSDGANWWVIASF